VCRTAGYRSRHRSLDGLGGVLIVQEAPSSQGRAGLGRSVATPDGALSSSGTKSRIRARTTTAHRATAMPITIHVVRRPKRTPWMRLSIRARYRRVCATAVGPPTDHLWPQFDASVQHELHKYNNSGELRRRITEASARRARTRTGSRPRESFPTRARSPCRARDDGRCSVPLRCRKRTGPAGQPAS
jgi:hypothetical protein